MTTAGEVNPMECKKARSKHDSRMRSPEIRRKISETMRRVRKESSKTILISKGRVGKRIDKKDINKYIEQGWKLGSNSKGKIRIHRLSDNRESTVWSDELNDYLKNGWVIGGKPNRISEEHAKKLAASHNNISDVFKKEQSERLKRFYKSNPNWITKSKHAVIISDPNSEKVFEFQSCLEAVRFMNLPDSVAKAGMIKRWVKLGYINRKDCKYNRWYIRYKDQEVMS